MHTSKLEVMEVANENKLSNQTRNTLFLYSEFLMTMTTETRKQSILGIYCVETSIPMDLESCVHLG